MTQQQLFTDDAARRRIHDELDTTIFVEAGAGTGKTRELIERLVRLVATGRSELRTIAAITFTEAAAAELRDRIRLRLEDVAREGNDFSEDGRRRCQEALVQLDAAAIETLHAFAQRILSDHALEAGLPPAIDVQEEIRASIAFDERWAEFVDELLSDPAMEETLLRGFSLGLEMKHLSPAARELHEHWDRLEAADIPDVAPPPIDATLVLARLEQAGALRGHCRDQDDKLYQHLERVDTYRRRLAAAETDLDRLRLLAERAKLSTGAGNKNKWEDITPAQIRELLSDAQRRRDEMVRAARASVLASLLAALRAFTLAYAGERRRSGRLEFHDLLVQARDLLRRDADVRREVRDRYTHLLIDELQDTDPLQIEIATLIAGDESEDAPPRWEEARVGAGRLFFVGDPKQSIYRFRRADIELYQRAQARFSAGLVRLTENFRALPSLIDWVNHVFGRLMGESAQDGQAAYVRLEPARPRPGAGVTVRVLGSPSEDSLETVREREAKEFARVVHAIKAQPWPVEDPNSRDLRAATYRDVALLMPTRTALPPIEEALEAAAIPYRVESRSLVYDTQEVRDLLSILRAIDDPTDEVALIAALRSPAFGCADDDLLRYRQAGGRWDERAAPPADLAPGDPVVSAMAALRSFHERRWWLPISGLVETVIRERRLFELAFAHRRPRERWQRLRFALDQARAFAEAGGRTLRQFIDWAERQAREGTRVIETAVPEPDDDAVRIMTIHAAKGLEFPIVVLAGLNVQSNYKAGSVLWSADGAIEASLASFETEGYQALNQREKEMDEREKVRLLYVAATRARDHLIVSLHHKLDTDCHARRLYPVCLDAPELSPLIETADIPPAAARAQQAVFDDSADRRAAWRQERRQRIDTLSRVPAIAATEIAKRSPGAEEDPNLQKERQTAEAPPWKRGRAGTAFGRAVHAVLQSIDLAERSGIESAARAQAAAEGIPARAAEIGRAVQAALAAPALREAVAGGRYWRELYVAAPVEGMTLEGFIDLLYETPEGLVVVDYKTDVVPDAAKLDEALARYRLQGAAYAVALQEALGRPVARCVFVFTEAAGAQEKAIPDLAAAMAAVRERLRQPAAAGG